MQLKDDLRKRTPDDERVERDLLGFVRQPEVRWLTPALLVKSGVEVLTSGTFGKFADKREIQRDEQGPFDYRAEGALWVDYASDTGDGFDATYTIAWLLARDELQAGGERLPRGRILLLGGDEVYPSAEPEEYENRFSGPFAAALPRSEPGSEPHMYATPGNHDWYDGLVNFLRLFCARDSWIGGWRTPQRRSYYAIQLANGWWIWAIDIQLDTYIDDVQLEYFRRQPLQPGDKVVLMTAKPAWVKAYDGRVEPASWQYLAFFEDRMVRDRGARLAVVLTGDTHHYARFEPAGAGADEAPTRVTAGGGGAYLAATHTLKDGFELQSLSRRFPPGTDTPRAPVRYARKEIYPRRPDSERLSRGVLSLRRLNPEFATLFGGFYAAIALTMLSALNGSFGRLELASGSLTGFLSNAFGTAAIVLIAVLLGGTLGAADITPAQPTPSARERRSAQLGRFAVAGAHALAHVAIVVAIVFVGVELLAGALPGGLVWLTWVAVGAVAFVAGKLAGPSLWGLVLHLVLLRRGASAQKAANDVFVAQSIPDYKNMLRMHFDAAGGLTIYPLGVDRVCTRWDHKPDAGSGSRLQPRGSAEPVVTLIDGPLRYDAGGARVQS